MAVETVRINKYTIDPLNIIAINNGNDVPMVSGFKK